MTRPPVSDLSQPPKCNRCGLRHGARELCEDLKGGYPEERSAGAKPVSGGGVMPDGADVPADIAEALVCSKCGQRLRRVRQRESRRRKREDA